MDKMEAIKYFDKCNKIVSGSQQIIDAIDKDKEINMKKALRASMLNSQILAIMMKDLVRYVVESNQKSSYKPDLPEEFNNIFGGLNDK